MTYLTLFHLILMIFYNSISNYEFFIKHFFTVNSPKLNLKYKKILEI